MFFIWSLRREGVASVVADMQQGQNAICESMAAGGMVCADKKSKMARSQAILTLFGSKRAKRGMTWTAAAPAVMC